MSAIGSVISDLINALTKVEVLVALCILIVIVWLVTGTSGEYYPLLAQTGGSIIAVIFVVIIVFLFCRYGPKP